MHKPNVHFDPVKEPLKAPLNSSVNPKIPLQGTLPDLHIPYKSSVPLMLQATADFTTTNMHSMGSKPSDSCLAEAKTRNNLNSYLKIEEQRNHFDLAAKNALASKKDLKSYYTEFKGDQTELRRKKSDLGDPSQCKRIKLRNEKQNFNYYKDGGIGSSQPPQNTHLYTTSTKSSLLNLDPTKIHYSADSLQKDPLPMDYWKTNFDLKIRDSKNSFLT
ncbi:unnamed protein product [Moneuplotes crassus]|uniref:Uncharacterized protein n=1 Tax=Euplotes crassus TaxID=5936 RepID=A0AAD1U039_EUPCR|nr:unnamed protein product [Moneuplotes crassus]